MNIEKIRTALETGKNMMGDDVFASIPKPMMDEALSELNNCPVIRAKFTCNQITPSYNQSQKTIWMNAVYSTEGENAAFSKATPSGMFQMTVDKGTLAFNYFELGKSYYLDFTEAPAK